MHPCSDETPSWNEDLISKGQHVSRTNVQIRYLLREDQSNRKSFRQNVSYIAMKIERQYSIFTRKFWQVSVGDPSVWTELDWSHDHGIRMSLYICRVQPCP